MEAEDSGRTEEIRRRVEKATPGPWHFDGEYDAYGGFRIFNGEPDSFAAHMRVNTEWYEEGWHNAEFVCHARGDIPYLLDELSASLDRERELKEQLEAESDVQALLRDENEELRWFYENMRAVDLHNLKMQREAESARPGRGGNPEEEAT